MKKDCKKDSYCRNCKGNHAPISRKCPIHLKEADITKIKVDLGISFVEARREYENKPGNKSYSNVASAQKRLEDIRKESAKDIEILMLKNEVEKLKSPPQENILAEENRVLREELSSMKSVIEGLRTTIEDLTNQLANLANPTLKSKKNKKRKPTTQKSRGGLRVGTSE